MSNTTHAGSSSLRHSRTHRQAVIKRQRSITTVVVARYDANLFDQLSDLREQQFVLRDWAMANDRQGRSIYAEQLQQAAGGFGMFALLEVRGLVTLPTKQGRWTITKAMPKEEAWARRKAGLSC